MNRLVQQTNNLNSGSARQGANASQASSMVAASQ